MPAFGSLLRNGFDKPVISNGGDALGNELVDWGQWLRRFQSGRVQQYCCIPVDRGDLGHGSVLPFGKGMT
jgi:hypothetical protein